MAVNNVDPGSGNDVKLRNELHPSGIRNCRAQRDMNFHQIVRTDLHVERFGEMSCLQPRSDPADAGNINLDDRAPAALQILSEM